MKAVGSRRHMIDLFFTIALFLVSAASALMVVLIGANVYQRTARGMDENFSMQTSLSYVAAKIRQNDSQGTVSLETREGVPVLVLTQTYNSDNYETLIYQRGNELCELFTRADSGAQLTEGSAVMEIGSFEMESLGDGLYRFSSTDLDGNTAEQVLAVRCQLEGGGV